MKYFLIVILLVLFHSSYSQKIKYFSYDSCIIKQFNMQCKSNEWNAGLENIIFRKVADKEYRLVDTSGLIVYTRKHSGYSFVSKGPHSHRKGYYSLSPCGEMYRSDYETLSVNFKDYPQFLKAIRKNPNDHIFSIPKGENMSYVNKCYHKYVLGY